MSTPQSTINICSGVRLNSRYDHSIYFASASEQIGYFAAKTVKRFVAYTFLRKSWTIKVEATMEQAKTWNYLWFHNSENHANAKVYFYFINNIEYVNDNTVELSLELDVLQTYLFDFELLPSFVERQHTPTDVIGEHTVEEGLELGEFIINDYDEIDPGNFAILIMCTINPESDDGENPLPALPYRYNEVFSGIKIWAVDGSEWVDWGKQLDVLSEEGLADSIVAMWMYPKKLIELGGEADWSELINPVERAYDQNDGITGTVNGPATKLDGYTPKNKKLHTYPYHFMQVTNNQGNTGVLHYERFDNPDNIVFALSGSLSPDGGVRITPRNYNGQSYNYEEGFSITGYPTCAWDSDIYKMWLAQNQNTQNLNYGMGLLKIAGGAIGAAATSFTGVGVGVGLSVAASGLSDIMGNLAQKADRAIEPPQARGNFSNSVNITNDMNVFSMYEKCVCAERARIIDDFFTMYGYKLNRVQVPNINARPAFTYVKTIGCHIKGNMCNEDTIKIETIFDSGVTFWKNGDKICDYSQSNSV